LSFDILPAIDVVDGRAVRLRQGAAETATDYGSPVETAKKFADAGARWIHLVDLDAAFGRGQNTDALAAVIQSVDINVELSGGIRDAISLERALSMGATRVNLGTAALEDPEWTASVIDLYPDLIVIGLDVKGDRLAARGWTRDGGELWPTLTRLNDAGATRYVVTDVQRDGMLEGPNLDLLTQVAAATESPVIASGGVRNVDDVRALVAMSPMGIEGVVIGKALYEGTLTIEEALEAANE